MWPLCICWKTARQNPKLSSSSSRIRGVWVSPDRKWAGAAPATPDGATPADGAPESWQRWSPCCQRSVVPLAPRALGHWHLDCYLHLLGHPEWCSDLKPNLGWSQVWQSRGPSDVAHSTDSNLTFCTLGRCVALRFRFRLRLESHFNFYSVAVHLITLILLGTGYQLGPWAPFVHQIFVRGEEPEPDQAKMLQ